MHFTFCQWRSQFSSSSIEKPLKEWRPRLLFNKIIMVYCQPVASTLCCTCMLYQLQQHLHDFFNAYVNLVHNMWHWHCECHEHCRKNLWSMQMLFMMSKNSTIWLAGCRKRCAHDAGVKIARDAMMVPVLHCESGFALLKTIFKSKPQYTCTQCDLVTNDLQITTCAWSYVACDKSYPYDVTKLYVTKYSGLK